jgi:hypothetical protein
MISSESHRHRHFISAVRVYENEHEVLTGISIEYEEGIQCNLIREEGDEVKILMEISERPELTSYFKQDEYEHMDDTHVYDNITHVFGTFSTKLEFIGFKCSSGKLYYTGNPNKGHCFLFGIYKQKLHTIKLGINKGICFLKFGFKDSKTFNKSIEDATDNEIFEEEKHIGNITNPKDKEINILFPYFDDSYIYMQKHDIGQSYFGFFNHMSIDNPEHSNYKDFYKFLVNVEKYEDKMVDSESPKKKRKFDDILRNKKSILPIWNKVSVKTLNTKDLLFNEKNLNSFIDKYIEELRVQIYRAKGRNKFLRFYSENIEHTDREDEDFSTVDERFNKILNNQFRVKTQFFKPIVYNAIETLKHETIGDESFESGFSDNTIDRIIKTECAVKMWKTLGEHIRVQVRKVLFLGIFGSLKALEVLEHSETGEERKKFSIDDKLDILDVLIRFRKQRKRFVQHINEFMAGYKAEEPDVIEQERTVLKQTHRSKTHEFQSLKEEKHKKMKEDIEQTRNDLAKKFEVGLDRLKVLHDDNLKKTLKMLIVSTKVVPKEAYSALFRKKTTFHLDIDTPKHKKTFKNQDITVEAGGSFTDTLYPAGKGSLCPIDSQTGQWIRPRCVSEQDIKDWELFKWERVDKFLDKSYVIFYRGIDVEDIIQGKIGNCYFQSAVAALTEYPKLVYRLFFYKDRTNNHQYGVYIRRKGIWELMIIDDHFPVYGKLKPRAAGCISQERKELWVMLLEKAWSKLNGSYANAIGGEPYEVFDALTNASSESIFFVKMNKKKIEKLWQSLINGENSGFIMTAGTNKMKNVDYNSLGLEAGHAYTLMSVVELENGVRLVKLRNPWANLEWSGAWGDGDRVNWTPEILAKLEHTQNGSDGIFYMEFNDFVKYFFNVSICKVYTDFVYEVLCYKITEVYKPNVTIISIEKPTKIFFQMHQNNPRFSKDYYATVLAFIMLSDKDNKYIASASSNKTDISIEADLEPGIYHLYSDINYRFVNSKESGYNITTYSKEPVNMAKADASLINQMTMLESTLKDYAKNNLKPITVEESKFFDDEKRVKLYMKVSSKRFPFIFAIVENELVDTKAVVKFSLDSQQSYYNQLTEAKELVKTVQPESTQVYVVVKHYFNTDENIEWNISCIPEKEGTLQEIVEKKGVENNFDIEGQLIEKVLAFTGGCIVLLTNNSEHDKVIELVLKNLRSENHDDGKNEILFEIKAGSKLLFHLHKIDFKQPSDYFFRI